MRQMLFPLLRDAVRLAFYTLVAGPALLLYVMALVVVQDGSPSEQFLSTARRLIDGAAPDKVMQCMHTEPKRRLVLPAEPDGTPSWMPPVTTDPTGSLKPAPIPLTPCHWAPVDQRFWTRAADELVTILWLIGALFGAAWAFMTQLRSRQEPTSDNSSLLHKKD